MSELTKLDIENVRTCLLEGFVPPLSHFDMNQLCDAALRGIEASTVKHESDAREYQMALRNAEIKIKNVLGAEMVKLADILAAKINGANHKPIFPVVDILDSLLLKQIDANPARIAELEARGWQKVPEGHVVVPAEKEYDHTHYQFEKNGRRRT